MRRSSNARSPVAESWVLQLWLGKLVPLELDERDIEPVPGEESTSIENGASGRGHATGAAGRAVTREASKALAAVTVLRGAKLVVAAASSARACAPPGLVYAKGLMFCTLAEL
jgi:hypothetical protein